MRIGRAIAGGVVVALACAPSAPAAVTVGQTFPPMVGNCQANRTILQDTLAGAGDPADYTVRSPGVITSWRFQAPASASPQIKLKVGRPLGSPHGYRIIGESALQMPVNGQLNTFPASIPAQPGDVLGLYLATAGACEGSPAPGYEFQIANDEAFVGDAVIFSPLSDHRLDVSASLEPDCDGDGFGDESQDPDIASCAPPDAPPDAMITRRPKDKTKKRKATFEFISNQPGSSFECSLDDGPFTTCSSPHEVKVKRGRHSFAVRATGSSGPGPADTDDWRVKRRKK